MPVVNKPKEHPILFSGPMVRAILDGRKTQTRQIVKPQPAQTRRGGWQWGWPDRRRIRGGPRMVTGGNRVGLTELIGEYCPCGAPGDTLWVRESFYIDSFGANVAQISYAADGQRGSNQGVSDRKLPNRLGSVPSIHMPRHCSRITLRVTGVRVERVQEISEADARAEGSKRACLADGCEPDPYYLEHEDGTYRQGFRCLWDSINAKRGFGWDANPWVWVVEFERSKEDESCK